jgi:TonB family protein
MPFLLFRCLLFLLLIAPFVRAQETIPEPPLDADQYRDWTAQYQAQFPAALKAVEKELKAKTAAPQLLYQKAILQLGLGDYARALTTLQNYAKAHPQDNRVWFQMARAHHFAYQYREAYAYYKKYSELHPQDPTPLLAVVDMFFAANDKPQALGLSEQIAAAFPQAVAAQANLAEAYSRVERMPEAVQTYEANVQKWPNDVKVQQELVSVYLRLKRVDDAVRLATTATERFPQSAAAWEAMGSVYVRQEKLTEAYQAYDTAFKLRPTTTARLAPLYTIGYSAILARNYPLAMQCYQRVLTVEAQDADALFRLGRLYALTGQKKEAEDTQKRLKKQDKDLAHQLSQEIAKPEKIEQEFVNTCANSTNESSAPLALKPAILYQEKAQYTDLARSNRVQGIIVVSAIFAADARITGVRVVRGLPDGLNSEAMKATRKIRFRPACLNGKPVSVRMAIEFTFNLL